MPSNKHIAPAKTIVALTLLLFVASIAALCIGGGVGGNPSSGDNGKWTCSMHPQLVFDAPGKCPVCFMDMIPMLGGLSGGDNEVVLDAEQTKLIGIPLTKPEHQPLRAVRRLPGGMVDADGEAIFKAKAFPADLAGVETGREADLTFFGTDSAIPVPAIVKTVLPPEDSSGNGYVLLALKGAMPATGATMGTAAIRIPVDDFGEPIPPGGDAAFKPLAIPTAAVITSGKRNLVFVAQSRDEGATAFVLREIDAGPEAEGKRIVLGGLEEGEEVVSDHAFRLDSALQAAGKVSMLNLPEGEITATSLSAMTIFQPAERSGTDIRAANGVDLDAWFSAYEEVRGALAMDDSPDATAPADKLKTNIELTLAKHPGLTGELGAGLAEDAAKLAGAEDLPARRAAFDKMSADMVLLARKFGAPPGGLRLVYCPMAFGGKGAHWLQPGDTVSNPYHGQEMPRCGWINETIE